MFVNFFNKVVVFTEIFLMKESINKAITYF